MVDTSRYTIDSALLTIQDAGLFNITLTQALLGPNFGPEFLNTTYIDTLLPGMIKKFGADQPVEINFATTQAPSSSFKPG